VRMGWRKLKVKLPEDKEIPERSCFLTLTTELPKLYAEGRLVR